MKFKILLFALFLSSTMIAQKHEVGLFAGVANYSGDLSGPISSVVVESNLAYGLFYRYNLGEYFSVKAHAYRGILSGSDANSDKDGNKKRNLSFETPIMEVGIMPEFNIYNFFIEKSGHVITPYATVGVAGFYFNPRAKYQGEWYELQPLGTEGQGAGNRPAKYKRTQISIPIGGGVKFAFNEFGSINVEVGLRKTFTDYLDDVSTIYPNVNALGERNGNIAAILSDRTPEFTGIPISRPEGSVRGNPEFDDWYFFGGLSISILLNNKEPEVSKN